MSSPCIDVCKYNKKKVCIGCYRKKSEVSKWKKMSKEKQKEVRKKAKKRREKARGEDYYGNPLG